MWSHPSISPGTISPSFSFTAGASYFVEQKSATQRKVREETDHTAIAFSKPALQNESSFFFYTGLRKSDFPIIFCICHYQSTYATSQFFFFYQL